MLRALIARPQKAAHEPIALPVLVVVQVLLDAERADGRLLRALELVVVDEREVEHAGVVPVVEPDAAQAVEAIIPADPLAFAHAVGVVMVGGAAAGDASEFAVHDRVGGLLWGVRPVVLDHALDDAGDLGGSFVCCVLFSCCGGEIGFQAGEEKTYLRGR
jgi:hypothetical protein